MGVPLMTLDVTAADVAGTALVFFLLVLAVVTVQFIREQRAMAAETRRMDEWEQEVAGITLPEWNGLTYDWPDTGLSRYLETFAREAAVPVPASRISGPMHMLDPTSDTDVFIATLRAQTDQFIALMDQPLEVTR